MRFQLIISLLMIGSMIVSCNQTGMKVGYEGVDLSKKVKIERDKETKEAKIKIDVEGEWKLYAGYSVDSIDFNKPILEGASSGVFPITIDNSKRAYFQLVTKSGKMILSEEYLPMAGGYNFRDMGGLKNKEGRFVKWGKLFRADELGRLSGEDLNYLSSIPIETLVDFRSANEIETTPDRIPEGVRNQLLLSINPGSLSVSNLSGLKDQIKEQGGDNIMISIYKSLSTDSAHVAQYRRFFEALQNEEELPLLFHCSAGKDRTGMAAALFLYSLGVEENVILDNYLASNIFLEEKYGNIVKEHPEFESMFIVKKEFLKAGIDEIVNTYGSVDSYLTEILKVDINKMKNIFLY